MLTQEEIEYLQHLVDDPDWDVSQRGDVWELLPRLLADSARLAELEAAARKFLLAVPYGVTHDLNAAIDELARLVDAPPAEKEGG